LGFEFDKFIFKNKNQLSSKICNFVKNKRMELNFEGIDRNAVAVYKKGEEPNDVLFWLSRPAFERIKALELIRHEYNLWKYGTEQRFKRVCRVVKRKR
jgi:hypothetical protein